jgi:hypothetical protein
MRDHRDGTLAVRLTLLLQQKGREMSFICGNCATATQPRQPVNIVVLATRPQQYENFVKKKGSERGEWKYSEGTEITKEIKACPPCYSTLTGLEPKVIEVFKEVVAEVPREKKFVRPRRETPRKPVDKTNPNWKFKQELEEIKRREARSSDPRGEVTKKKPVVETINRIKK